MATLYQRHKRALLKLEQRRNALQVQLDGLEQCRARLQQQNQIVSALCDSILYVHPSQHALAQRQQDQHFPDIFLHRVEELLEAEGTLLERLDSCPLVPDVELLRAAGVDGQGQPSICPADDPTALLKWLTSRTGTAHSSSSSQDLTLLYREVVAELAVYLQLLDASLMRPDDCAENIKQCSDRLLHCLLSCHLLGRPAQQQTAYTDTLGGPGASALTSHNPNVVAVVTKLQLTPGQQQAIADHWKVWRDLLAPLDAKTAQLQQQMQELCHQDASTFSSSTATTSAGTSGNTDGYFPADAFAASPTCSSSSAASAASSFSLTDRTAVINSQMQLAQRLQVVVNKRLLLHLACTTFFIGRLSWVQFARLVVLSWPSIVSFELACMAVEEMVAGSLQKQQQQGKAKKQRKHSSQSNRSSSQDEEQQGSM